MVQVGRYTLCGEVARGGLAAVHLGAVRGEAGFSRVVAVKRLHAQYAADPSFVAMLSDEARLSARIRHANVVTTLDVVRDASELLVVMEYVAGATLAELIVACRKSDEPFPPAIAAAITRDALLGLHAAHGATDADGSPLGIVHRDVSPQNVIVGVDGVGRVLDFGVAKARARSYRTEDGTVRGKLGYMAPEQLYGEAVDARTDVFGAGVLLWEALCARRLFVGPDGEPALAAVLEREVAPPSSVDARIPKGLDDVVARAVGATPASRFPTARAMATALEQTMPLADAATVASWLARRVPDLLERRRQEVSAAEQNVGAHQPEEPLADLERVVAAAPLASPPTRSRAPVVGAVIGVALLAATGGWFLRGPSVQSMSVRDERDVARDSAPAEVAPSPRASHVVVPPTVTRSASLPSDVRPPVSAVPRPKGAPAPRPVRVEPPSSSCNPPYVIDDKGHKRYKRACLR